LTIISVALQVVVQFKENTVTKKSCHSLCLPWIYSRFWRKKVNLKFFTKKQCRVFILFDGRREQKVKAVLYKSPSFFEKGHFLL